MTEELEYRNVLVTPIHHRVFRKRALISVDSYLKSTKVKL